MLKTGRLMFNYLNRQVQSTLIKADTLGASFSVRYSESP